MKIRHVLMLLTNPFRPDLRVQREIRALVGAGYRVTLVCWDRRAEFPASESAETFSIIRIQDVRSGYALGWKQILYLPRFLRSATQAAMRLAPDVVHCHDLDTLHAGVRLKRQLDCRLVYDSHENYPALMANSLPGPFVRTLRQAEKKWIRNADLVITASTLLRDELVVGGMEKAPVDLGNFAEMEEFKAPQEHEIAETRASLGTAREALLIAYIGGLTQNRALQPLLEAAPLVPEAEFHLWGEGRQRRLVEEAAARYSNLHFHGWLPPQRLAQHFHAADVIYYGLNLEEPSSRYNAPNTLSQAMASGKPVIATDVGDLGKLVREAECGILLQQMTSSGIARAVRALSSPQLRAEMGARGFQAARTKYNAGQVQRRLVAHYDRLFQEA